MVLAPLTVTALGGALAANHSLAAGTPQVTSGHPLGPLQVPATTSPAPTSPALTVTDQAPLRAYTPLSGHASLAGWPPPHVAVPLLSHNVAGGEVRYHIRPGDNVAALASRFGIDGDGLARRVHLYPRLDANLYTRPLPIGSVLEIDNRYIVPAILKNGILVSIAQRRVFLFRDGHMVKSYPAAVGDPEWQTPVGRFQVIKMQKDPPWIVPRSIQEDMWAYGEKVVKMVKPDDPQNPLGPFWIGLSLPNIGIHGTISPYSIYRFESHGCIRLENNAIRELARQVSLHESGDSIYEPVLMATTADGGIYLEVHPDIYGKHPAPYATVQAMAAKYHLAALIDWRKADQVIREKTGIAENVALSQPQRLVASNPMLHIGHWAHVKALPPPPAAPLAPGFFAQLEQWWHAFSFGTLKSLLEASIHSPGRP
jgi:L,D-transpeptidase ErfK/SrfK